jgi:hypothetical protein
MKCACVVRGLLAIVLPPSHEETAIINQPFHLEARDAGYVVVLYLWLQVRQVDSSSSSHLCCTCDVGFYALCAAVCRVVCAHLCCCVKCAYAVGHCAGDRAATVAC